MQPADPISLYDRLLAVKPVGLSLNGWTVRAGVSRSVFADIRRRGNVRHDTLAKLLDAVDLTFAQFEAGAVAQERDPPSAEVRAPRMAFQADSRPRDVPLLGTAECGAIDFADVAEDTAPIEGMQLHLDEVIDHLRRPASLDNRRDVYAIYFRGESMAPRFHDGEVAYVDPRRPPAPMDYVIVQLRGRDGDEGERVTRVLAKRLVRKTADHYELEQYAPPAVFRIRKSAVAHLHRIIPWDELVAF